MSAATAYKIYQSNHFDGMDPRRLILMLYDGALRFLKGAREGALENNPQKRGENLGRAIAIIGELQTSLNPEAKDEASKFLRGLYASIMRELPMVSLDNNVKRIEQTERYITQLKTIWVEQVMALPAAETNAAKTTLNQQSAREAAASATPPPTPTQSYPAPPAARPAQSYPAPPQPAPPAAPGYGGKGQTIRNYGRSFSA